MLTCSLAKRIRVVPKRQQTSTPAKASASARSSRVAGFRSGSGMARG
jgi:hypothetical protein